MNLLLKDAVMLLVPLVAEPEARTLGNTFRECGSEIWNRKGLKRDEFPHAQLGPIPLRNGVCGFIL